MDVFSSLRLRIMPWGGGYRCSVFVSTPDCSFSPSLNFKLSSF